MQYGKFPTVTVLDRAKLYWSIMRPSVTVEKTACPYHSSMATQNLASHINAHPDAHDKLYKQVALRISELIEHGTLRPGERIPSVRVLSEQEEVSIATVMQAYRVLES